MSRPPDPARGALELDRFHDTLMRMNGSGTTFVAALNGTALGGGAELSWACDVRIMAAGPFFIGQPEVLLGLNPAGGGTQTVDAPDRNSPVADCVP